MDEEASSYDFAPEYVANFQCIGSDCEDTCCKGWKVDIDRDTYANYRKVHHPELKPLLDEYVKRNLSETNFDDERYATLQMKEDGSCPLLTGDRLCKIHKELGQGALSTICSQYPRTVNVVLGRMERTLTMSCPEAARLALLNKEKMNFVELPVKQRRAFRGRRIVQKGADEIEYYFDDLRLFSINLLQYRDMPIAQRVIALGLAMRQVQDCVDSKSLAEIPGKLEAAMDDVISGRMLGRLEEMPADAEFQLSTLKSIVDRHVSKGVTSLRYLECYAGLLYGLGFANNDAPTVSVEKYKFSKVNYFQPFLQQNEHIFENMLVNNVWHMTFPLIDSFSVYDSYLSLALSFAWIKLLLIGMAGFYAQGFEQAHALKLIQSFTKVVEHNVQFKKSIIEEFNLNGYYAMSHMAMLLQD